MSLCKYAPNKILSTFFLLMIKESSMGALGTVANASPSSRYIKIFCPPLDFSENEKGRTEEKLSGSLLYQLKIKICTGEILYTHLGMLTSTLQKKLWNNTNYLSL